MFLLTCFLDAITVVYAEIGKTDPHMKGVAYVTSINVVTKSEQGFLSGESTAFNLWEFLFIKS